MESEQTIIILNIFMLSSLLITAAYAVYSIFEDKKPKIDPNTGEIIGKERGTIINKYKTIYEEKYKMKGALKEVGPLYYIVIKDSKSNSLQHAMVDSEEEYNIEGEITYDISRYGIPPRAYNIKQVTDEKKS